MTSIRLTLSASLSFLLVGRISVAVSRLETGSRAAMRAAMRAAGVRAAMRVRAAGVRAGNGMGCFLHIPMALPLFRGARPDRQPGASVTKLGEMGLLLRRALAGSGSAIGRLARLGVAGAVSLRERRARCEEC